MDMFNQVGKEYRFTVLMRMHVSIRGNQWKPFELTQWQCMRLGFLSGNHGGDYYCYNTTVERCGDVIKFRQNTKADSSVNTRYSYLPE